MKHPPPEIQLQYSERQISINRILTQVWDKGLSAVYYRLPNDSNRYLLIDLTGKHKITDPEIESMKPGFILAPFKHTPEIERWFIQADVIIKEQNKNIALVSLNENTTSSEIDALIYGGQAIAAQSQNGTYYVKPVNSIKSTTHSEYTDMIREAIEKIDTGVFQKVVPARQMCIDLSESFDPMKLFDKLCEKYPNTFVSLVTTPQTGTWIGASPEILLKIDANRIFSTTALAGTQLFHENIHLMDVAWTQKDIEEQAMVSRYIINCFKKIRLREFDEIGPKSIKAGNLIHLKTNYIVDLKKVDFPQLGTIMLKLLHPTSAVCGLPEPPATDFIQKAEPFDRALFAGYLGPVNINSETSVFVNLRCMNLLGRNALLYAGAGVTIDSDPEKEWIETKIKLKTLLDLI